MYVSSLVSVVIIIALVVIIALIVWYLTHANTNIPCDINGSCPSGLKCVNGVCAPLNSCTNNLDCSSDKLCVEGMCVECVFDRQCPIGSVCQDGRCAINVCQDDTTCPAGNKCVNNICQPTCMISSDCVGATGEIIICDRETSSDGIGICITLGNHCQSNQDCNRGTNICIDNKCQQCRSDSDCQGGTCHSDSTLGINTCIYDNSRGCGCR